MRPRVIVHNAVSLDGKITGFEADIGLYYSLAGTWGEDATLAGSETILAATAAEGLPDDPVFASADAAGQSDSSEDPAPQDEESAAGPLLVVPDSRGRVRCWSWLLAQPYWSRGVALTTARTPPEYSAYLGRVGVQVIEAGEERVDLAAALESLHGRLGVRTVRVDAGGTLNAALLLGGLVDEVSLLVHPVLVGDERAPSLYRPAENSLRQEGASRLQLKAAEPQPGGLVWLRYTVTAAD